MKSPQELLSEAEFQLGCAKMWDAIAGLGITGPAALDATLRAVAHRECARAIHRQLKIRNWVFWGFVCVSLISMLVLTLDGLL